MVHYSTGAILAVVLLFALCSADVHKLSPAYFRPVTGTYTGLKDVGTRINPTDSLSSGFTGIVLLFVRLSLTLIRTLDIRTSATCDENQCGGIMLASSFEDSFRKAAIFMVDLWSRCSAGICSNVTGSYKCRPQLWGNQLDLLATLGTTLPLSWKQTSLTYEIRDWTWTYEISTSARKGKF